MYRDKQKKKKLTQWKIEIQYRKLTKQIDVSLKDKPMEKLIKERKKRRRRRKSNIRKEESLAQIL